MTETRTAATASKPVIIALDGPAGSGKSSTAKALAERLHYAHLDTGAWYRVLTLIALRTEVDPHDEAAVRGLLDAFDPIIAQAFDRPRIVIQGHDVSEAIRTPEVSGAVSRYSRLPVVREHLNAAFRHLAATTSAPGVVAEGRDITTVTFPQAEVRVLLTASAEARARRRAAQIGETDVAAIARSISMRDARDLSVVDFIRPADGVTLIDTSDLTLAQVTDTVAGLVPAAAGTDPNLSSHSQTQESHG
ncbi:(d)CMP kinase [Pseudoclavibacter sp. 13-3]|uniref:(d)CMP kinase n=1 Tax=Pseudoclavibacter sp. 13-3 TaxID=2901228 RepID=UPI001E602965|nr:(d)CMP kinase [Pseudoclavibacter sp. 13-3]MCD7102124.1 (d)CMP kinase [Pseudoclavibacter sp. 13-3]